MKILAYLTLLGFGMGLPAIAIYGLRWSRRRQQELRGRYGHWTENEANILQRQAFIRGDWTSSLKWALLAPITKERPLLEKSILVLVIGALLILCGTLLIAIGFISLKLNTGALLQAKPVAHASVSDNAA